MDLEKLRKEIDEIDRSIIRLLCRRFQIARDIAKIKKKAGLDIEDNQREKDIIENCKREAKDLDEAFVEDLMRLVISHSKKIQQEER
jgi:chorismate mutase